jgi:hypothetical protein
VGVACEVGWHALASVHRMINLFYWLHLQHVTQTKTLRAFLAAVAVKDFEVHKLHVKTEFLKGDIEEELYLKQPRG